MPSITERLEERDPLEMRVLTRHTLGFVDLPCGTCIVLELSARNPITGAVETTTYVASLAGAVTLCSDLTNVVESDTGILALVRSTLADARSMKREKAETDRVADEYLADVASGREPCPTCAGTPCDGRCPAVR